MAIIGGRLEAVAPRRTLLGPDYLRLVVLAAVSAAVHLWLISHTAVTARDGIGFARYALALQSPHAASIPYDHTRTALNVIKDQQHPPGYPVMVWLTAKVVRVTRPELPLSEGTLFAAQIVSGVAALFLVVPTYLLGRMLFGRNVGFAAALLFQVLPVPARMTSDALTEGLYLLVVTTALVLGARAVRRPGIGGFLLCGLATGAGFLVRPEGLMVAGAVGLVAGWLGLTRVWPRDLALGRLTALAVGVTLVAGPYVLLIGKLSNKPGVQQALPELSPKEKMMQTGAAGQPGAVFATWWHLSPDAGPVEAVGAALLGAVKETGKGLHYLAAGLALFGAIAVRRRITADPGVTLLFALVGLNLAALVAMGVKGYFINDKHTFYVAERHTLLIVLVGCLLSAAALEPLAAALARLPKVGGLWAGRLAPAGLLVALVAAALPSTLKPLHQHREGFKHAGLWLKEVEEAWVKENEARPVDRREPSALLVDPFEWSGWYSGRTLYCVPGDPENPTRIYAVIDNHKTREGDHERLPRLQLAMNVRNDTRRVLVYHWPEDVSPEDAKVHVYRLDIGGTK